MRRSVMIGAVCCSMLAVAGCQRLGMGRERVAPLPATPMADVSQGSLQPLDPQATPPMATGQQGTQPGNMQVASAPLTAPASAVALGRDDMIGGWKMRSGADNCSLYMALTTWTGGYRANTRGCTAPELSGISAWDLTGKVVALKNSQGGTVAQLYATAPEQFTGQTASGQQISIFR